MPNPETREPAMFVADIGGKLSCPIASVSELLRLINGGARIKSIHPTFSPEPVTDETRVLMGEPVTPEEAWQELVEFDDRTSPEEYPEMALITRDELIDFIARCSATLIETQASELAAMREALEPFAASADYFENCEQHTRGCPDDAMAGELVDLTVGDFRKARTALGDAK